jgi:hypothetical protein
MMKEELGDDSTGAAVFDHFMDSRLGMSGEALEYKTDDMMDAVDDFMDLSSDEKTEIAQDVFE